MKLEWRKLYGSMQEEIKACTEHHVDEVKAIERCFQISTQYLSMIEDDVRDNFFSSVGEEIEFYKNIKPLFISEIRFQNMLYHAALFKPSSKLVDTKEFWAREMNRLEKFIRENRTFYDYFKSGSTQNDETWFRKPIEEHDDARSPRYDMLTATLMALEKYAGHIKQEQEITE